MPTRLYRFSASPVYCNKEFIFLSKCHLLNYCKVDKQSPNEKIYELCNWYLLVWFWYLERWHIRKDLFPSKFSRGMTEILFKGSNKIGKELKAGKSGNFFHGFICIQ